MRDLTLLNARGATGGSAHVVDLRKLGGTPVNKVRVTIQAHRTFTGVAGYSTDGAGTVKVYGRAPGLSPVLLATRTEADFTELAPTISVEVDEYPEYYAVVEGMEGATEDNWYVDRSRSADPLTPDYIDFEADMPTEKFAVPYANYGSTAEPAITPNADGPIRGRIWYPAGQAPKDGWPVLLRVNQAGISRNDMFGDLISGVEGTGNAETLAYTAPLSRGFAVIDVRVSSPSASNANDGGVWRAPYDLGDSKYDVAGDPDKYQDPANNKPIKDVGFIMQWLKEYGYGRLSIDPDSIILSGLSGGGVVNFEVAARPSIADEGSRYPVLRHDQQPAAMVMLNVPLYLSTLATDFPTGGLWCNDVTADGTPATDLSTAKVPLENLRKSMGPWWAFNPGPEARARVARLPFFQWQNQNIGNPEFGTIDLDGNDSTDPFDRPKLELTRPFPVASGVHDAWHAYMLRKQLLAIDAEQGGEPFHRDNSDFVLVGPRIGGPTTEPYEPSVFFQKSDLFTNFLDSFAYQADWLREAVRAGLAEPQASEYSYTVVVSTY